MSKRIGIYEVQEELARGGAGVVYRAVDPRLGRQVAIKVLLAGQKATPRQQARFRREVEALGQLRHPHVVPVHDAGEHEGALFLVMSFVPGGSLEDRLEKAGPFKNDQAARLLLPLAQALAYCHDQGVLHRDLKPLNVLLDERGQPLLTDFGLVRALDDDQVPTVTEIRASLAAPKGAPDRLSLTGQFLGTPGYWAPEQARGEFRTLGPAADIYGLGGVLYALLTGQAPVTGISMLDVLAKSQEPVASPRSLRRRVDRKLERICLDCLALDPTDRYASARALAEDLGRYLAGDDPLGAAASGLGSPVQPRAKRSSPPPRGKEVESERTLGVRFVPGERLDTGRQGVAYSGLDRETGQPVTLRYLPGNCSDASLEALCQRLRDLKSDVGRVVGWARDPNGNRPVLVHVSVPGEFLSAVLERTRCLPIRQGLWLGEQIMLHVEAVHASGDLVRGFYPSLIQVHGAQVHVLPGEYWGVLSDSTRGDYTSWVAPEVLDRSDAADAVSEVFELGTFLFRLLTGESPIPGKTVRARIMSSLNGLRLKLRERLPSAPAELEAVFDRALESDPADRYRSVEAFRKALQSVAHLV